MILRYSITNSLIISRRESLSETSSTEIERQTIWANSRVAEIYIVGKNLIRHPIFK
jgi:hypothetical protein